MTVTVAFARENEGKILHFGVLGRKKTGREIENGKMGENGKRHRKWKEEENGKAKEKCKEMI